MDLEELADFIALDNPLRALRFIAELRARCERICDFPDAAPLRPDIAEDVRLIVVSNHLILYAVRDEAVVIERIVHGARHLPDIL